MLEIKRGTVRFNEGAVGSGDRAGGGIGMGQQFGGGQGGGVEGNLVNLSGGRAGSVDEVDGPVVDLGQAAGVGRPRLNSATAWGCQRNLHGKFRFPGQTNLSWKAT